MSIAAQGRAFLSALSRTNGCRVEGLPQIAGMTQEEVEAMLLDLAQRGLVRLDGPSNANSNLGRDVESVEITNLGYMTAD